VGGGGSGGRAGVGQGSGGGPGWWGGRQLAHGSSAAERPQQLATPAALRCLLRCRRLKQAESKLTAAEWRGREAEGRVADCERRAKEAEAAADEDAQQRKHWEGRGKTAEVGGPGGRGGGATRLGSAPKRAGQLAGAAMARVQQQQRWQAPTCSWALGAAEVLMLSRHAATSPCPLPPAWPGQLMRREQRAAGAPLEPLHPLDGRPSTARGLHGPLTNAR
jgi:hypothetical protein